MTDISLSHPTFGNLYSSKGRKCNLCLACFLPVMFLLRGKERTHFWRLANRLGRTMSTWEGLCRRRGKGEKRWEVRGNKRRENHDRSKARYPVPPHGIRCHITHGIQAPPLTSCQVIFSILDIPLPSWDQCFVLGLVLFCDLQKVQSH